MKQTSSDPRVFDLHLPPLRLEAGARVDPHILRGSIWEPSPSSQAKHIPTVLVIHALTGDMCPGGDGGFWAPVTGPGKALDPERYRILCFNNLGSCYGSSGPASEQGFPNRTDDRPDLAVMHSEKGGFCVDRPDLPATITSWDQARSILLALDKLGIEKIHLVTGGSLGGMIALCLAVLAPQRFERIAPFAASTRASPWVIGWNHIGRQTILASPDFPSDIARGLELARQIAHMTYRADAGLWQRQGRHMGGKPPDDKLKNEPSRWRPQVPYAVQTYLEHQGRKLERRFDGRAYLAQLDAMDHHDIFRYPGHPSKDESWIGSPDESWGTDRIRASCLAIGINSDALFSPEEMKQLAEELDQHGCHSRYAEIESVHGHDAFLIEWDQVDILLRQALDLPTVHEQPHFKRDFGGQR